ncbi:hypothetical protein [Tenacibaculum sp. 190524A02b]|uniref:Uncharacterized protein n=1 Tax=Tenacibaculum vairaonense TaxID=3137860 RepID=A0ABM9PII8_9FLAO
MRFLLRKKRKFRVRKVIKRYSYLPFYHKGSLFWLTRIEIEKSFNGISMRTINVQKI